MFTVNLLIEGEVVQKRLSRVPGMGERVKVDETAYMVLCTTHIAHSHGAAELERYVQAHVELQRIRT
jgi:hypothetical protein